MRFAFFLSGACGFALVALVGLAAERQIDGVLRDAALGCLLAAYVGRWFWHGLETAFAETLFARRAAAEEAEAEAEAEAAAAAAALSAAALSAAPVSSAAPSRVASPSSKSAPAPALAEANASRR
jgi:hypothetical protein